ncbi:ankyrin repeat-containing domain protein [Mycena sanguinolenta]|nr:ankyrin repeat-containing domain protein [Mycena sanguinolenta]
MAVLAELAPELLLHIVGFLTRENIPDTTSLPGDYELEAPLPDLSSINALSQTNSTLYRTLNQSLYDICASVKPLGKLALLFAVRHQLESAVERLVPAGVDLDSEFGSQGNTCGVLHYAAAMGHRSMVVKLLAMHGAEMQARAHARTGPPYYVTALDYAVGFRHLEVVKLLAPIPLPVAGVDPQTIPVHKEYLGRALVEAAKFGNSEICEYLVSVVGADVNFVPKSYSPTAGGSPIYQVAGTKNVELIQFLLVAGANPNLHDNIFIPLFNATRYRNLDVVQALLVGGADIHAKNRDLKNVLSYCTDIESLQFFLERGVEVVS